MRPALFEISLYCSIVVAVTSFNLNIHSMNFILISDENHQYELSAELAD